MTPNGWEGAPGQAARKWLDDQMAGSAGAAPRLTDEQVKKLMAEMKPTEEQVAKALAQLNEIAEREKEEKERQYLRDELRRKQGG